MHYRVFQYPLPCPTDPAELNAFLASHRIASVKEHLVESAGTPTLVFVVRVAAGSGPAGASGGRDRVDYQQLLDADQFAVFSSLRDERKKLAEAEGIPLYAVFSNAQLAEMVRSGAKSEDDFLKIDGVGKARVEKYGAAMLAIVKAARPSKKEDGP